MVCETQKTKKNENEFLKMSLMSLIAVPCQPTDLGFHRASTSAPQVPRFSVDQLWRSLDTRSNSQRTTKANGMVLIKFSHSALRLY